jgi:RHS repeat-associated protein
VREVGGVRTVVVDDGYEVQGGVARKVYRLGGDVVAVREGSTVDAAVGDHLGSVTVLAQGGSPAGVTRYLPYGAIRLETGLFPTDRRFTGQRWEQGLGLYDYRARFYDPTLGRFLQPDSLVSEPGNPQALNRYAYVYNNPLKYTDPSGHWLETAWDILNIVLDIQEIRQDPGNLWNWGALVVDVGTALLPGVPAFAGVVSKGGKAAKAAVEVASHADEVVDAGRVVAEVASHADEAAEAIKAGEKAAQELTGQWHHVLSNRILRALEAHPTLHGLFDRNDLVVQALDEASHRGYQAWHRTYDRKVVKWLAENTEATREEFLKFLREIYARPEMRQRFPNALNQIDRLLEEKP